MAAETVFLDTNGLLALLNADDWLHGQAVKVFEGLGRKGCTLLTTNLVLGELGNGMARGPARRRVARFIRDLLASPLARVVFVEKALLSQGLDRFDRHTDKDWGLVGCVSFELMSHEDTRDAFTCDRHFEQAGFTRLLRDS